MGEESHFPYCVAAVLLGNTIFAHEGKREGKKGGRKKNSLKKPIPSLVKRKFGVDLEYLVVSRK